MQSVMKSEEPEIQRGRRLTAGGTSQTPTLTLRLLTGGAACQQAMLETPLCPKLVGWGGGVGGGCPWKLEGSRDSVGGIAKQQQAWPPRSLN